MQSSSSWLGAVVAAAAVALTIPASVFAQMAPVLPGPSKESPGPGETFAVAAFRNASDVGSLNYLAAGLPAFLAERLAHARPLRFVGPSTLLGGSSPARWMIGGSFARAGGEKVAVTVSVRQADRDEVHAEATRVGSRDQMPALALAATVEVFSKVMGVPGPLLVRDAVAPLARDPYAFILYARGVGAHVGMPTRDNGAAPAQKWLTRALRIDPRSPEIMRYLGVVELAAGDAEHARANWLSALDVRPDYVAALADVARLDRESGRPSVHDRYARLVQLDPDDRDARRTYGQLLAAKGDYPGASRELRRVLAQAPEDLSARRALVPVLAASGDTAELLEDLEAIVRLDGDSLEARFDLAAAYTRVGRLRDAQSVYEEVLRRKPRQSSVLKFAGDLAFAQGDYGKAIAHFAKMRTLLPSDPRPPFRLGAVYFASGDLKAAERWFSEAAHLPGMLGPAYANLGAIALRRGQVKEALWLLGRAVKRRPAEVDAHFNLALALLDDHRPAEALAEVRTAEGLAPDDAGIRFLKGVASLRLDQMKEAEEAFRETLRLDPKHLDAQYNLALLRSRHPRESEALLRLPLDLTDGVAGETPVR